MNLRVRLSAAFVPLGLLFFASASQDTQRLVRTQIIPVELPITAPFDMLGTVAGPNGTVFAQFEWEAAGQAKSAILEIGTEGKVKTTFDRSSATRSKLWMTRLATDVSGKLYCYETWSGDEEKGNAVYVFSPGGELKESILLSKPFHPRQLVITPNRRLVFAALGAKADATPESQKPRQAIYEFGASGKFIREVSLSSRNDPSEPDDPQQMSLMFDVSHLLVDEAGNFFLIRPLGRSAIIKFDGTGNVIAHRELQEVKGVSTKGAILDDQGRLVLDRVTMTRAGGAAPEQKRRIVTVLDSATLETQIEAEGDETGGFLFSARGGEFFFFSRREPTRVEIFRASIQ